MWNVVSSTPLKCPIQHQTQTCTYRQTAFCRLQPESHCLQGNVCMHFLRIAMLIQAYWHIGKCAMLFWGFRAECKPVPNDDIGFCCEAHDNWSTHDLSWVMRMAKVVNKKKATLLLNEWIVCFSFLFIAFWLFLFSLFVFFCISAIKTRYLIQLTKLYWTGVDLKWRSGAATGK